MPRPEPFPDAGERLPEEGGGGMTSLKDVLLILFRRKTLIATIVVVATGATAAVTYLRSPQYVSTASFLVHRERPPTVATSERPNWTIGRDEVVQTEVAILSSRSVLGQVVDELKLESLPRQRSVASDLVRAARRTLAGAGLIYEAPEREGWINWIGGHMTIKPIVDSSVITVSLAAEDPELARDILAALSRAYLDKHAEAYRSQGNYEFYEEQVRLSKQTLDDLHAEEEAAKNALSISSVNEQRTLLLNEKTDLDQRIRSLAQSRDQLVSGAKEIRAMIDQPPPAFIVPVSIPEEYRTLLTLQNMLVDLENEQTELMLKYQPDDRKVTALASQIRSHRQNLADGLQATAQQIGSRLAGLAAQRDDLEKSLQSLNQSQRSLREISLAIEAAEKSSIQYRERLEDARLNTMGDRHIVNLSIIDEPDLPSHPERARLFFIALAFGLSTFLGLGAALVAELTDPAMHTPADARRRLGLPVVAVIPMGSDGPKSRKGLRRSA